MKTPLHKITLYVAEVSDILGLDIIKQCLENGVDALVVFGECETKDIGEWSDEHPLNQCATNKEYIKTVFPKK